MAKARYSVTTDDREAVLAALDANGEMTLDDLKGVVSDGRAPGKMMAVKDGVIGRVQKQDDGTFVTYIRKA